jgi:hypothetical protein
LEQAANGTRITTSMSYRLCDWPLLEWLLCGAFDKVVQQIAGKLKAFYETGETQNKDFIHPQA